MTEQSHTNAPVQRRNNGAVVAVCLFFVVGMVGMSYAAVPLYKIFCQVTGYGGTVKEVEQASDVILDQTIKIRFDSNVAGGLPWEFAPDQREIELKIGETTKVFFRAKNIAAAETTGQSTFNVTPQVAGAYFNKLECFCFTEQTLAAGEEAEMPVVFFVDPEIVKSRETESVKTITLSYTFYPHEKTEGVAAVKTEGGEGAKL